MLDTRDQILRRTEAFAADLTELIKKIALDAVTEALSGTVAHSGAPRTARATRGPRVSSAKASSAPATKRGASKVPARTKRAPGEKRPPNELIKATEQLGVYVKANPGSSMEAISKALGKPRADLALPVKKLVASKAIRFEGVKRSRRYFPA